jgi:hypothetical protein
MAKLEVRPQSWGVRYIFHCPGCGCDHMFDCRADGNRPSWTFDGDLERPTFSPSLFYPDRVCHSFVRDGRIEFLADCTHSLAGRTVELPEADP